MSSLAPKHAGKAGAPCAATDDGNLFASYCAQGKLGFFARKQARNVLVMASNDHQCETPISAILLGSCEISRSTRRPENMRQ